MKDLINKNNYQWYFFEYLEGNLNEKEQKEVENFLMLNPDLQSEFDFLSKTVIRKNNEIEFPEKELLKRIDIDNIEMNINSKDYDLLCIEYIEGNLSNIDKIKFEKELSNNETLKKKYKLYSHTKLKPDLNIKFKEKIILKKTKKNNIITTARWAIILSVAASIVLFIFLKNINKLVNDNSFRNYNEIYSLKKENNNLINNKIESEKVENNEKTRFVKRNFIQTIKMNEYNIENKDENDTLSLNFLFLKHWKMDTINPILISNVEINKPKFNFTLLNSNNNSVVAYKSKSTFFNNIKKIKEINFININKINTTSLIKTGIEGVNLFSDINLQFDIDTFYNDNFVKIKIESKLFAFARTKKLE